MLQFVPVGMFSLPLMTSTGFVPLQFLITITTAFVAVVLRDKLYGSKKALNDDATP